MIIKTCIVNGITSITAIVSFTLLVAIGLVLCPPPLVFSVFLRPLSPLVPPPVVSRVPLFPRSLPLQYDLKKVAHHKF